MMNGPAHISRFEALARRLIEGSFGRLLGGRLEPQDIAVKLAQSLEDSSYNELGQINNSYEVFINPTDLAYLDEHHPGVKEKLANYLIQLANQANLPLSDLPAIKFLADDLLRQQQVRVVGTYDASRDSTKTRQYRRKMLDEAVRKAIQAVDAFLIIDGGRHVSLDMPLITIGRRNDNDVILDSATASRKHAQIRWRYNHFIIYDLGSRAGTKVNGQTIRECVLTPGDVIQMSDVTIIYGEGATISDRSKIERLSDEVSTRGLPTALIEAEISRRRTRLLRDESTSDGTTKH